MMTFNSILFTMLSIASYAASTGVSAQNVYRCGNTYSQTPCANAHVIAVDDSRDAAQKKQTDDAILNDKKLAETLEKERLVQEKKDLAASRPITVQSTPVIEPSKSVATKITPKRPKSKHKKPKDFEAEIPGTEPQVTRKAKSTWN